MKALAAGLFVLVVLIAAAALAPLGAALRWAGAERTGLSAAGAEGTVWSGRLRQARLGPVRLGDVEVRLDPASLVGGGPRVQVAAEEGAFRGTAALVDGGVEAAHGELALSLLRTGLPLPTTLRLEDVSARFEGGRCVSAGGMATTAAAGVLPALSGAPHCEGGALILPLAGRGPTGEGAVRIALRADGTWTGEARVRTPGPQVAAGLRLAGFVDTDGTLVREESGRAW